MGLGFQKNDGIKFLASRGILFMKMPVLLQHPSVEKGVIARTKQYAIVDYKIVVDLTEDAEEFIRQGCKLIQEGYEEMKEKVEEKVKEKEKKAAKK